VRREAALTQWNERSPPQEEPTMGSQVPCETPRGVRQKRDRNAAGCTPCGCEMAGRNMTEPMCSLVKGTGGAEPLESWRRQNRPVIVGKCTGLLTRGSRDGTSGRESAEHGRPRSERVATATCGQGASRDGGAGRGVGRVHCTCEGGENRWRDGALLDDATTAAKDG
jgi:hypothetical protein